MQTRKQSLIESLVNILIGITINMSANFLIFPLFGWEISMGQNTALALSYTVISIIRSYLIRRYYNRKHSYKIIGQRVN